MSFHNRYAALAERRHAAPTTLPTRGESSLRVYGAPSTAPSRAARDRRYWAWLAPEAAAEDEKREKEKDKEKAAVRVDKEEVAKRQVLTVEDVDMRAHENAVLHHTDKFECTSGEEAEAVLRRAQAFTITITFNVPYNNETDDLFFIVDADEESRGKNLRERFKLDEKTSYDDGPEEGEEEEWRAWIVNQVPGSPSMDVGIWIPSDCPVGEWDLKVQTKQKGSRERTVYSIDRGPFIVLFNPWSKHDQVDFDKDKSLLDEYVLNDVGSVFSGTADSIGSRAWSYGQFDEGILDICLSILRKSFGFKMTPQMGDPVVVARALSRILNDCGDQGVLVGNWSGDYEGGERPTSWTSSAAILRRYHQTAQPVKYGQCWVFSHLLTSVSRALGIPCRSVTNFDSAHDTDNTCTIDSFYDKDGEELKHLKDDSIWNFHVWNEVWIRRPDLEMKGKYDGWHVVDATPQEQSHGVFQCGPCPVAAVKNGEIGVGFDTGFVFSEVNAEVVHWVVDDAQEIDKYSYLRRDYVGNKMSTKAPDGKPHKKKLSYWNQDDPSLRLDLTDTYKFNEGSAEEREAVRRAVRYCRHGKHLYTKHADLEVKFDRSKQTFVGEDLVLTCLVKNASAEDREVQVVVAARTCRYWNQANDDKVLAKQKLPSRVIKAGNEEAFSVTVASDAYMDKCDESLAVFAYACAKDVKADMPYSTQHPFRLRRPDLEIKGPDIALDDETVTMTASLTNPLSTPLTGCWLAFSGNLKLSKENPQGWEDAGFCYILRHRNVKPKETVTFTIKVVGRLGHNKPAKVKTADLVFQSDEISSGIAGQYIVEIQPKK